MIIYTHTHTHTFEGSWNLYQLIKTFALKLHTCLGPSPRVKIFSNKVLEYFRMTLGD